MGACRQATAWDPQSSREGIRPHPPQYPLTRPKRLQTAKAASAWAVTHDSKKEAAEPLTASSWHALHQDLPGAPQYDPARSTRSPLQRHEQESCAATQKASLGRCHSGCASAAPGVAHPRRSSTPGMASSPSAQPPPNPRRPTLLHTSPRPSTCRSLAASQHSQERRGGDALLGRADSTRKPMGTSFDPWSPSAAAV